MKHLVAIIAALVFSLFCTRDLSASDTGLVLLVDGKRIPTTRVARPTKPVFPTPEVVALQTLRPGEHTIEIMPTFLALTEQDLAEATFHYDMGDGTVREIKRGESRQVTHTYHREGSYLIDITATIPKLMPPTQYLTTVQLNITADQEYKLPKAKFTADADEVAKGQTVSFDASQSEGEGLSFVWDFGDGQTGEGQKVSHRYENPEGYLTVALKVTDKNGFMGYEAQGFFTKKSIPTNWVVGSISGLLLLGLFFLGKGRLKTS